MTKKSMKQVKFYTLGCKVNQYETQGIREQLLNAGFGENHSEIADIYIINTCTVTVQADSESRRLIRKALRSNPKAKIIVTGCYVKKDAEEILRISERIRIVPNQQKHRIAALLGFTNKRTNEQTNNKTFIPLKISDFKNHQRAFVKIQDGCNNFCAYCKIPLVRGRSRSRSLREIIKEVTRLVDCGFKEIVLTGICLGDYHYRNLDLADVVNFLAKIKGKFRIRASSIEPQLVRDKLIEVFNSPKVCPHFHIPLQSGDDEILKKMNRQYTVKNYLSLVAKIKKRVKDVAITTDVLVGFPGETDRNFCNTVRCLEEVSPLRTHIFSFSPREGTSAFNLPQRIKPQIIKERATLLREVTAECSYKFRKKFLGKEITVLIESRPDKKSGYFCGYSENYIRVLVEDASKKDVNRLVQVKVESVGTHFTKGIACLARGGVVLRAPAARSDNEHGGKQNDDRTPSPYGY